MNNESKNAFVNTIHEIKQYFNDKSNKNRKEKLLLVIIALVVRGIFAIIFYGSIDISVVISGSLTLFKGEFIQDLPYFPIIPAFLWIAGLFNTIPFMPISFSYKIVPILFDVLMTILIYDYVGKKKKNSAFKIGLLYALSPVGIIITSIHGQWDSIVLFTLIFAYYIREVYKDTKTKYFVFGAMFALSIMVKPVSIMFLIFFFSPLSKCKSNGFKKTMVYQMNSVLGFLSVVTVCFSIFSIMGYKIINLIKFVLIYSDKGIIMFGLPFLQPFDSLGFLKQRSWLVFLLIVISIFYYLGKIRAFDVLLVSLGFVIGFSGLAPQYLFWLIPFLLITQKLKLAAVYTFISTTFLMFYYMNPNISHFKNENMATFTTLKAFKWLMPPKFLSDDRFLTIIHILGDALIPMCALFIGVYVLIMSVKKITRDDNNMILEPIYSFIKDKYLISIFVLSFFVVFLYFTFKRLPLFDMFYRNIDRKYAQYSLEFKDNYLIGLYPNNSYINIVYIMILCAILWAVFSINNSLKNRNES